MKKCLTIVTASLMCLMVGASLGCETHRLASPEQRSAPDMEFEQDGKRYAVANGDFFEVRNRDEWVFIENLNDPDFHDKNYVTKDDGIH